MGLCFGSEAKHGPKSHISKPSTSGISGTYSKNVESSATASSVEQSQFSELASGSLDESYWDHNGQILDRPNLKEYTFNDMKAATRNFKPEALLGEGGFGKVYKGWLDEKTLTPTKVGTGMVVAIKKLNPESVQGVQEWQSEVNFLGRFSHPNLVKLLGFCGQEKDLLLVYEFMPKGSLENHLFRKNPNIDPLSWEMRLKITIGAARGLAFLHTSEKNVIYRDFKASNILLDENYNAKISDFGLAKFGPPAGASHVTTRIMGTYGYAAPEYIATGHLYVQSDVYGFGVVLLEIMTGLRAVAKMQSTAFNHSLSIPLHKSRTYVPSSRVSARFDPIHISASCSKHNGSRSFSDVAPRRSWSLLASTYSDSKLRPWSSFPPIASSDSDSTSFEVKATSVPDSAGEANPGSSALFQTLQLGALFGLWYLFNIYFNIYNKQVLKVYHFPITITLIQFTVGSAFVLSMWSLNLYKRPKISGAQLAAILPLAMVHTLGNLFTNMSLGKVAVSFTHTIKAMEPFFSVILSAMFLGETPTGWVVASLVPIVGGVALASVTEASFNWAGFWSAMASNLTFQSRNVLSKKLMVKKEDSMDNIMLFSIITVMSFLLLAPVAFFMEGVKFTPAYLQSAGINVKQLYTRALIAALCFHAYQQVSYMILQRVSPVTHSVGNCVKRVVVIVSSVLFFRTPVSPVNALGTGIALTGVFLYSRVKRIKPKTKTA